MIGIFTSTYLISMQNASAFKVEGIRRKISALEHKKTKTNEFLTLDTPTCHYLNRNKKGPP